MSHPDAVVEIVSYDPEWPARFDEERATLLHVLRPWLTGPIEHIGSTAVPGLVAKPVIDIMAGVQTLDASRPAIAAMATHGYCYFPYQADREHWFCKPSPQLRTHHLHLVPFGSPQWGETLAFRDYLRAHRDVAAEYGQLKQRLAQEFHADREAYTQAKQPFIESITALALRSGYPRLRAGQGSRTESGRGRVESAGVPMTAHSRREFLTGLAGSALMLGAVRASNAAAEPVLGMIFPPLDYPVPPEAARLYPSGVKFLAKGIGLEAMTPDSFDQAIPKVLPAARALVKEGATAISVMGTSLTFYKGRAFNENLTAQVKTATGLPVTTMSTGIVEGLRAAKAKRVAVATAYNVEVTGRLKAFLEEYGFEILAAKGLGYEKIPPGGDIIDNTLQQFCADTYKSAPQADTLLISCGGLKTLDLIVPLERECKVPVVSSTPHAMMTGVRLLGLSGRVQGFGRVLASV
jgi:GrpB-like predicted nucleotidyltransferase (UPF0157 family)/maleate cis-trans isomerase